MSSLFGGMDCRRGADSEQIQMDAMDRRRVRLGRGANVDDVDCERNR